ALHPGSPGDEGQQKSPAMRGFSQCAREDSNLHGLLVHKALNLARLPIPPQALGAASIARRGGASGIVGRDVGVLQGVRGGSLLSPSRRRAIFANTCSTRSKSAQARRRRWPQARSRRMDLQKDLTKRQQEIFDFIKRYSAKYGYPPTVRDIGKAVGLASSSTVHAHLANLE